MKIISDEFFENILITIIMCGRIGLWRGTPPAPREAEPPTRGKVVSISRVGGLHHRYRRAA